MAAGGQTLNDRILAARHSLAGQGLAKAVCKATTEELIGPKRKHLDYLLRCTEEPNVSIPQLANLLLERTQSQNWIVVFKSLVTIHHMMCYGNERFTQYLASSNANFQLSNFLDKSGVQGYDMSPYVRRYAKYLNEKAVSYRTVAFDFCKVKRGKDGGNFRQMSTEKLLKTLPVLQQQQDSLLEFDATAQDLNNGVINGAFMLLFRDLIRLFACYNDGIINLLEKYFEMNKKNARDALDVYKRFLIRMDRVGEFLKVAESVGIDKGDIPDLAKAPSSLLEALEGYLANLEGRKPGSAATTPTGAGSVNVAAAVNILSSTSSAFGSAATQGQIDENLQKQLLAEEEQAMQKYKEQAKATNPFFSGDAAAAAAADSSAAAGGSSDTPNILDLFAGVSAPAPAAATAPAAAPAPAPVAAAASASSVKASDDLLQLSGNPFASVLNAGAGGTAPAAVPAAPAAAPAPNYNFATPGFTDTTANANGFFGMSQSQPQAFTHPSVAVAPAQAQAPAPHLQPQMQAPIMTAAATMQPTTPNGDSAFFNAFGEHSNGAAFATTTTTMAATTAATQQQQQQQQQLLQPSNPSALGENFFGAILQPQGGSGGFAATNGQNGQTGQGGKMITGDLDASLANLTSNLNLDKTGPANNLNAFSRPKGPAMAAQQQPTF